MEKFTLDKSFLLFYVLCFSLVWFRPQYIAKIFNIVKTENNHAVNYINENELLINENQAIICRESTAVSGREISRKLLNWMLNLSNHIIYHQRDDEQNFSGTQTNDANHHALISCELCLNITMIYRNIRIII